MGCAFEVANTLGCGFLEKVYENAILPELRKTACRRKGVPISVGDPGFILQFATAHSLHNPGVPPDPDRAKLHPHIMLIGEGKWCRADGASRIVARAFHAGGNDHEKSHHKSFEQISSLHQWRSAYCFGFRAF